MGTIWYEPSQARMQGAIRQIPSFLSTLLPSSHIGGGLHSLATTALLTECPIECSIECSIGLLPNSHTDPSSSASTGSPAGSLAATDSYRVLTLTITVADAICCG